MGGLLHLVQRGGDWAAGRDCSLPRPLLIISGFGIYGAAVVPDSGVGNTWQRLTLVLHEFLFNGLTPSRLHIVISFLTHADHVFLGLPPILTVPNVTAHPSMASVPTSYYLM